MVFENFLLNGLLFLYNYSRGTLHLKSLKTATVSSSFQQLPLPPSNLTSLRMSAKYGGYYFIRARSKFTDLLGEKEASADSGGEYVTTFISAVSLCIPYSSYFRGPKLSCFEHAKQFHEIIFTISGMALTS